ncbi:putative Wall-associated receptor kinase-like 5 [Cocos nucifera]|uniref:Putative Wall-associated receptor kinase-like 5 n=1 Tax=Cocos nucifera TaxID=13894 RepID=A0A8K0IJB7_COCNU|nr:putative Wall-associated receptor kinase-like 5 [Cocos nucifera]
MACKRELVLLLQLPAAWSSTSDQKQALPGCPDKCGNIPVPYPFGIGPNCSREGFEITCSSTNSGSPRASISGLDIEVTDIYR